MAASFGQDLPGPGGDIVGTDLGYGLVLPQVAVHQRDIGPVGAIARIRGHVLYHLAMRRVVVDQRAELARQLPPRVVLDLLRPGIDHRLPAGPGAQGDQLVARAEVLLGQPAEADRRIAAAARPFIGLVRELRRPVSAGRIGKDGALP
ncbi:hypothetical protein D3C81_1065260 [compost metagenome]